MDDTESARCIPGFEHTVTRAREHFSRRRSNILRHKNIFSAANTLDLIVRRANACGAATLRRLLRPSPPDGIQISYIAFWIKLT
jgi:hypothetical protein